MNHLVHHGDLNMNHHGITAGMPLLNGVPLQQSQHSPLEFPGTAASGHAGTGPLRRGVGTAVEKQPGSSCSWEFSPKRARKKLINNYEHMMRTHR